MGDEISRPFTPRATFTFFIISRRSFLSGTLMHERNFQIVRPSEEENKEKENKSCERDGVARPRALLVETKPRRRILKRKRRKRRPRSLRRYRFRSWCALQKKKLSTRRISRRRRRGKTTTMVLKCFERNWTKSFGVPRRVLILLLLLITTREAATRD